MTYQLLTSEELDMLQEIHRLLEEANIHSLSRDGYCKSGEGHISVYFGNHWNRLDPDDRKSPSVDIYSYLLAPQRNNYFDSIEQALEAVRQWHYKEMAKDNNDPWEDEEDEYPTYDDVKHIIAEAKQRWSRTLDLLSDMEEEDNQ